MSIEVYYCMYMDAAVLYVIANLWPLLYVIVCWRFRCVHRDIIVCSGILLSIEVYYCMHMDAAVLYVIANLWPLLYVIVCWRFRCVHRDIIVS